VLTVFFGRFGPIVTDTAEVERYTTIVDCYPSGHIAIISINFEIINGPLKWAAGDLFDSKEVPFIDTPNPLINFYLDGPDFFTIWLQAIYVTFPYMNLMFGGRSPHYGTLRNIMVYPVMRSINSIPSQDGHNLFGQFF